MASQDAQSGTSTPRSFTKASAEDLLKSQTVGLVNLDDFRKRRAEVLEEREKQAQDRSYGRFRSSNSGTGTPASLDSDGGLAVPGEHRGQPPKKKKKKAPKGLLSFGDDEVEGTSGASTPAAGTSGASSPGPKPLDPFIARRLTPNPSSTRPPPKALTKAAIQAEAAIRDNLRKDFLALQETVRNTEVMIPFVFYDGTNVPGGVVKIKKGDNIWLFLDRCRKVGAELGIGGAAQGKTGSQKNKNNSQREWARISVDDLMFVREEVIIPHHYEFYYFIANKVRSSKSSSLLFNYSNELPKEKDGNESVLRIPGKDKNEDLEGKDAEPSLTKVVDRRWYEKHKHIFPASLWKVYEAGDGFEDRVAESRRDAQGNAFFFS